MIVVKGSDPDDVSLAEQDIEELLIARHRIGKNQENDFEIRNSAEFQEKMKSTVQTFAILLASIASVSLLVGGIGIMNIMLVSVTERIFFAFNNRRAYRSCCRNYRCASRSNIRSDERFNIFIFHNPLTRIFRGNRSFIRLLPRLQSITFKPD